MLLFIHLLSFLLLFGPAVLGRVGFGMVAGRVCKLAAVAIRVRLIHSRRHRGGRYVTYRACHRSPSLVCPRTSFTISGLPLDCLTTSAFSLSYISFAGSSRSMTCCASLEMVFSGHFFRHSPFLKFFTVPRVVSGVQDAGGMMCAGRRVLD